MAERTGGPGIGGYNFDHPDDSYDDIVPGWSLHEEEAPAGVRQEQGYTRFAPPEEEFDDEDAALDAIDKEYTRRALKGASDALVDMTVETPWDSKRSLREGGKDA